MPENKKVPISMMKLLKPEIEELIKDKNLKTLKEILCTWHPSDIAELLDEIDTKEAVIILRMLLTSLQSEVFAELSPDVAEEILRSLSDRDIKAIISELDPDDRAELFEEMPSELTRRLINMLSPEDRRETLQLLGYPKGSIGRLMTPDYVAIKSHWSIEKAMEHIRKFGKDAETIDTVYVVDDEWHLLDDIPIRRLILTPLDETVDSIMDHHFVSVTANTRQEEAIKLFEKYNLIALPVTDEEGHLLGIVTVDDIIDALREEQTEDFTKFAAVEAKTVGLGFITRIKEVSIKKIVRARITWLFALLIMDLVTGGIIQSFESIIAKYVVLVTFLPVLVDTAGNAGSQSATLVIRALALGTVKLKDWAYLLGRELIIAGILGVLMGLGISVMGVVRGGSYLIAQVVVLAMVINVIIGSLIGVQLPFIFTKFKKDPAAASTPLITTLADIIGTGIYLGIAYLLIGR